MPGKERRLWRPFWLEEWRAPAWLRAAGRYLYRILSRGGRGGEAQVVQRRRMLNEGFNTRLSSPTGFAEASSCI